jgi:hypothetical protein
VENVSLPVPPIPLSTELAVIAWYRL